MKKLLILTLVVHFACGNSVLDYINSIRNKSGAAPLKYSSTLAFAAKKHAVYLSINREFGHVESSYKEAFYGTYAQDRIAKAGFATKAVVENISFYERNYKASIDKLFSTVYHRLAFLDPKVDIVGFAKYRGVYVYDMSNSKLADACQKSYSLGEDIVENICKNSSRYLPRALFGRLLYKTQRASGALIIYPYPNQANVPAKLSIENPRFLNSRSYGLPVIAIFNPAYYRSVNLLEFKLFLKKREVAAKTVTFRNDRYKKIKKGTFVLVPLKPLKKGSRYKAVIKAIADGKKISKSWEFETEK